MWFERNIENILNRVKNHGALTAAGVARSLVKTIRGKNKGNVCGESQQEVE